MDLSEARDEIAEFLTDAAAKDPGLVGLTFVARVIDEKFDEIGDRVEHKLDQIDEKLLRIALGIEALARAAAKVGEQ